MEIATTYRGVTTADHGGYKLIAYPWHILALVRCLEREIAFSVLNNLLFRTNFIESAFLERCFIARLHCFRLGNHNRIHTKKQYVCL